MFFRKQTGQFGPDVLIAYTTCRSFWENNEGWGKRECPKSREYTALYTVPGYRHSGGLFRHYDRISSYLLGNDDEKVWGGEPAASLQGGREQHPLEPFSARKHGI